MAYFKLSGIWDIGNLLQSKFGPKHDDDVVDRINYAYTPALLGVFAALVAMKQYVGEPLQCWIPAHFKGPWESYSEKYCFVENTYFVGLDEDLFPRPEDREARELIYYQWVPIMLCIQLLLFVVPKAIWSSLNWRTGFTVTMLVDTAKLYVKDKDKRKLKGNEKIKENSEAISSFLLNVIKLNQEKYNITNYYFCGLNRFFNGNYVTFLYLAFKLLNCLNTLFQLVLLNKFLGPQYSMWGWGIAMDLWHGRQWHQSGHFPRVTYCDVQVREIGQNIHNHTFQCVLMINMFNEKIYIFIWFWLFFLLILNIINFFYWIWLGCFEKSNKAFLYKHLRYKSLKENEMDLDNFFGKTLYKDAVTTLRLLEYNCGDISTSEIVYLLHQQHLEQRKRINAAKSVTSRGLPHRNALNNMSDSMMTNYTDSTSVE